MLYFPEELGCWSKDNFTNVAEQGIYNLGQKILRGDMNSIVATFIITDEQNLDDFLVWWSSDAEYGNNKFIVALPFFGGISPAVSTVGDLVSTKKNAYWEIKFTFVTILTDDEQNISAPTKIIDLNATDTEIEEVIVSWTDPYPQPLSSYDLYAGGILIVSDVVSPYADFYTGTRDYYLIVTNPRGSVMSNIDSGTGVIDDTVAYQQQLLYDNTNISTEFLA